MNLTVLTPQGTQTLRNVMRATPKTKMKADNQLEVVYFNSTPGPFDTSEFEVDEFDCAIITEATCPDGCVVTTEPEEETDNPFVQLTEIDNVTNVEFDSGIYKSTPTLNMELNDETQIQHTGHIVSIEEQFA